MENTDTKTGLRPAEVWTISVGLILAGLAIAITGVSYLIYMKFTYQWLVWVIGVAFIAVGLLTMEWPRGLRSPAAEVPEGRFRQLLILSIPLAFVLSSQVCGIGIRACNAVCHVTNLLLIGLAVITAVRLHRGQSVVPFLIPMVVVSFIPHCVCHAPINTLWHRVLGNYAPTCEMMPMAATLFSITALRGVRPRFSSGLVIVLFAVMAFIIVGGILFGFPWQGCVDHPGVAG